MADDLIRIVRPNRDAPIALEPRDDLICPNCGRTVRLPGPLERLADEVSEVIGRRMTSYAAIRTDLVNAGAEWVDEPVVEDRGLVTSRKPDGPFAFRNAGAEPFGRGQAGRRTAAE